MGDIKQTLQPIADDLDILHPERTETIGGRQVTVREFTFVEGLRANALAKPFIDDLVKVFSKGEPDYETVLAVIGAHDAVVIEMVAMATDVDADWVRALPPEDGELLLAMWWGANAGFFGRAIVRRAAVAREVQQLAAALPSVGGTFMPPSSSTVTPSPTSGDTQSAS
ncbi:DUF6631 family protein [Castellaniella hirudinis]|uniref:DUF6631 family protein n=1 Tax=Castellaniella hirudinis TaxID=1144617 RepID=UPI0039C2CFBA